MLNPEQIKARAGKLTASRISCLMTGDAAKIHQLYLEMTDQALPEDLSGIWAVRLGELTEPLNLEWFERKNGAPLSRQGEVVQHATLPWAAATLDAWCDALQCVVEAKHVSGREPLQIIFDRYAPQTQWLCEVTGADSCALSIIQGANEPVVEFLERDDEYIKEMIKRGEQFMACVRERRPPVILEPAPLPVEAKKTYDMNENEEWQRFSAQWLQTKGAAETAKESERTLKSLVPPDALRCFGAGTRIVRDRAGRLSLREDI